MTQISSMKVIGLMVDF